jgi:hypothetical protein
MRLGSVIFKVQSSCEASEMWFFPILEPYKQGEPVGGADHIPLRADLSDLRDWITWCRANDETCRAIADNASKKHARCLARDSILDYMQLVLTKAAQHYEHAPSWWTPPEPLNPRPRMQPPRTHALRQGPRDRRHGALREMCSRPGRREPEAAAAPPAADGEAARKRAKIKE